MRYRIVGFNDVNDKARGVADIVRFRPEHQFDAEKLPSTEELKEYATKHGYFPSGKSGASTERCDPVFIEARKAPEIGNMSPPKNTQAR